MLKGILPSDHSSPVRFRDNMIITVIQMQCGLCGAISGIRYWAELMSTEGMRQMMRAHHELRSNTARFPRQALETHGDAVTRLAEGRACAPHDERFHLCAPIRSDGTLRRA